VYKDFMGNDIPKIKIAPPTLKTTEVVNANAIVVSEPKEPSTPNNANTALSQTSANQTLPIPNDTRIIETWLANSKAQMSV
jgi:hypothetical protein